jgi:hypothetical protein
MTTCQLSHLSELRSGARNGFAEPRDLEPKSAADEAGLPGFHVSTSVHLLATIAKLMRPGGVRAVVAESLLLKHQLVIG